MSAGDAGGFEFSGDLLSFLPHARLFLAETLHVFGEIRGRTALQTFAASAGFLAAAGRAVGVVFRFLFDDAGFVAFVANARRRLAAFESARAVADGLAGGFTAPI